MIAVPIQDDPFIRALLVKLPADTHSVAGCTGIRVVHLRELRVNFPLKT